MIEVRSNSDRTSCLKRKPTFLIFFADSHGGGLFAAGRGRVSEPSAGGGHQGEGRQGGHGLAEVRQRAGWQIRWGGGISYTTSKTHALIGGREYESKLFVH